MLKTNQTLFRKVVIIVIVSKVEISLITSEEERIPRAGGIK